MRFLVIIGICFTLAIGVHAQETADIQYEVVTRLEIDGASGVTWSPDGSRLAVTAWPKIQIWDTDTWALLQTIPHAPAYSTKWSPNGDMLAGVHGGRKETVLIWDPTTGQVVRELIRRRFHDGGGILIVHNLAWSPDGTRIATDSAQTWRDLLLIWDLDDDENPESLVPAYPHMPANDWMNIASLEWSDNGRWLLADGSDGNFRSRSIIRLFDAITGETIRTIFPGFNPIWGPNDEQFAGLSIGEEGRVVNIWDTDTGEILSTLEADEHRVYYISWNFDVNVIAGIGFDSHLIVWDVETAMKHEIEAIKATNARDLEWRPNGNQLAIADLDEGVTILDFDFGG